jgi:hypothetical protein
MTVAVSVVEATITVAVEESAAVTEVVFVFCLRASSTKLVARAAFSS